MAEYIPSGETIDALRAYAKRHGSFWKRKLLDAWQENGPANEPLLVQARNKGGPAWLFKFKFPQATLRLIWKNGYVDSKPFQSFIAGKQYAREHVSLTGGSLRRLELVDAYGSTFALWDHEWTPEEVYYSLWQENA